MKAVVTTVIATSALVIGIAGTGPATATAAHFRIKPTSITRPLDPTCQQGIADGGTPQYAFKINVVSNPCGDPTFAWINYIVSSKGSVNTYRKNGNHVVTGVSIANPNLGLVGYYITQWGYERYHEGQWIAYVVGND